MKNKYEKMQRIKIQRDCIDKMNMTIPKGTIALIQTTLHNPRTDKDEFVLLIDNGTEVPETYPKSLIEEDKIAYKEVKHV
jgi:hypothetical protein